VHGIAVVQPAPGRHRDARGVVGPGQRQLE
jgi:hypothetical protein